MTPESARQSQARYRARKKAELKELEKTDPARAEEIKAKIRERYKVYHARWYAKHRERICAKIRADRQADLEGVRAYERVMYHLRKERKALEAAQKQN